MSYFIVLNNMPWVWFIVAILCLLIEAGTMGLTTVWFALSALVMIPLSFSPLPVQWQVLVFLCISAVLIVFTRPVFVKKLKVGRTKTNVDALAGKKAVVTIAISEFQKGEIKVNGVLWAANEASGGSLDIGEECIVERIEGTTAIVRSCNRADSEAAEAEEGSL